MYPHKLSLTPGGPFTLFAPVDAAFDKFAGKAIGKKEATQIVNKHLVRILRLFFFASDKVGK